MYQVSSTNAPQKVCRILKILSNPESLRLADIAAGAELSAPTSLRILETLIEEGFVRRDPANPKRYLLGNQALVLGMAMQGREHVRDRARPALVRLAAASGDTALLSTRHGIESVCVDREFGSFPIRANYLDVGSRRPLGAGAGSLALLAWLPVDECETIIELVRPAMTARYPRLTSPRLRDEVQRSRDNGYAVLLDAVVEQMGGVSVPIFGADGRPVAAISIAALSDRISSRLPMLVKALQQATQLSVNATPLELE
ncbi:MAG: IclR family transcriptional regulator [Ramlibacter sp.]